MAPKSSTVSDSFCYLCARSGADAAQRPTGESVALEKVFGAMSLREVVGESDRFS
jgi:hypothetical protein